MGVKTEITDLDKVLMILENPIRRKILSKLVDASRYPLQLSKELNVSQQAIMKHLKKLEEYDFVSHREEASDLGGPPRKSYVCTKEISLKINVSSNIFDIELDFVEQKKKKKVKDKKDNDKMTTFIKTNRRA